METDIDLVIVGAGIAGLSAALIYDRMTGGKSRILILDNHDDFGGHAKRNELIHDGKKYIANGGSGKIILDGASIHSKEFLRSLGVDFDNTRLAATSTPYQPFGMTAGTYFESSYFLENKLVLGFGNYIEGIYEEDILPNVEFLPVCESDKRKLKSFLLGKSIVLEGFDDAQIVERLKHISYSDFLLSDCMLSETIVAVFHRFSVAFWGVGTDALPAYDLITTGFPGRNVLTLSNTEILPKIRFKDTDLIFFPDGNASIARRIVARLIPCFSGHSADEVGDSESDYGVLDSKDGRVKIRLNSTAVNVINMGKNNRGKGVEVTYVNDGSAYIVRSKACLIAGWGQMLEYICPGLPQEQIDNISYREKSPIIKATILLKNGLAFNKCGVSHFYSPTRIFSAGWLDCSFSFSSYSYDYLPDQPVLFTMVGSPFYTHGASSKRDKFREMRRSLYSMDLRSYKSEIADHLDSMLGPYGFSFKEDVLDIVVNRWPHGYSYEFDSLNDTHIANVRKHNAQAVKEHGNIVFAGADMCASANMMDTIDGANVAIRRIVRDT